MTGLGGRGALVTGGGSGIGLACARRLAADGATVTICGRTEGRLAEAAEEIGARWVVCDVTDEASVVQAVERSTEAGNGLHIAVANAGGGRTAGPLVATSLEGWNDTLAVNLTGTFLTIKQCSRSTAATRCAGAPTSTISSASISRATSSA